METAVGREGVVAAAVAWGVAAAVVATVVRPIHHLEADQRQKNPF